MSIPNIASLNIDADPVECYYETYGINKNIDEDDPLYLKAIPRCLTLLKKHNIKATFFITARSFNKSTIQMIKKIKDEGHEIASHSYSHNYKLVNKDPVKLKADIDNNESFLNAISGQKPVGFRAPGYNISSQLFKTLKENGYSYDSSSLPSPLYFLGKWIFIRIMKLIKKDPQNIIHSESNPFDSNYPYQIADSMKQADKKSKLIEFPISSVLLIPFIGTSIILLPLFILNILISFLKRRTFINIELHIIDFADSNDSKLYEPILAVHPGLKYPASGKEDSISYVISSLKKRGYDFRTLADCINYFS